MAKLSGKEFSEFIFALFSLSKETSEFKTRKTLFAPAEYGEKNYYSIIMDFINDGSSKDLELFFQKFENVALIDFHLECQIFLPPLKELSIDFVADKVIEDDEEFYIVTNSVFLNGDSPECQVYIDPKAGIEAAFNFPLPKEVLDLFVFNINIFSERSC